MYDRTVKPIPPRPTTGLRYRIESLVGITGVKMAKYRTSWTEAIISPLNVIWRPHIFGLLVFEAFLFGFGIGINVGFNHQCHFSEVYVLQVTNAVFLGSPPPLGSDY